MHSIKKQIAIYVEFSNKTLETVSIPELLKSVPSQNESQKSNKLATLCPFFKNARLLQCQVRV